MKDSPKTEIMNAYIAAANEGDLNAAYWLAKWADDAGVWFECLRWLEPTSLYTTRKIPSFMKSA